MPIIFPAIFFPKFHLVPCQCSYRLEELKKEKRAHWPFHSIVGKMILAFVWIPRAFALSHYMFRYVSMPISRGEAAWWHRGPPTLTTSTRSLIPNNFSPWIPLNFNKNSADPVAFYVASSLPIRRIKHELIIKLIA
jgi:hypothetical protein